MKMWRVLLCPKWVFFLWVFFLQFGIATSYVGFAFCTVADRDNSYFFATAI